MAFVVSALLLIGCSKAEHSTNRSETAAPSPATAPSTTTATASADIGVPECDAFLKAYEACVHDKVPAATRATFDTGIAAWKKNWKTMAENPQTKAALVTACKSAQESAKTSMKAYGCTF